MHKVLLSLLILAAFAACSSPNPDYATLEEALMQPGVEIIGAGMSDNVFLKIPATDRIKDIANRNKSTIFWSDLESGNIINHIVSGTCVVDAKIDYMGNCPYRLYCGNSVELMIAIATNTMYATEICK